METRSKIMRTAGGTRLMLKRGYLLVEQGPDEGIEYVLKDRPVIIGRADSADLQLADPAVSREHVILRPEGERWHLSDLESKSGTRIDGVAVKEGFLEPGKRLELGDTVIQLLSEECEIQAPVHEAENFEGLIGKSAPMRELFGLIRKVGPLDLPVLLRGESGTGKERLARAVHTHGPTPDGPYVVVDCTLLGEGEHMRSELFGHVKGAFTGADRDREGAFVRGDGGTVFLDEIGELPAALQPQLLRVLQEGEVRALGGEKTQRVRVRVVSATNRDLAQQVAEGRFRQDLYYRLSALTIEVPALRDRGDDIVILAESFLPDGVRFDDEAKIRLKQHKWPGNVRELEFVLQQASALCEDGVVKAEDLRFPTAAAPGGAPAGPAPVLASGAGGDDHVVSKRSRVMGLSEEEIKSALAKFDGNRKQAAEYLGVSRATLFRRLRKMRDD